MADTIKPARLQTELPYIVRREENGGKVIEADHLTLVAPFVQSVPINGALPDISPPWDQQFVTVSASRRGMRLIKGKAPNKNMVRKGKLNE